MRNYADASVQIQETLVVKFFEIEHVSHTAPADHNIIRRLNELVFRFDMFDLLLKC